MVDVVLCLDDRHSQLAWGDPLCEVDVAGRVRVDQVVSVIVIGRLVAIVVVVVVVVARIGVTHGTYGVVVHGLVGVARRLDRVDT